VTTSASPPATETPQRPDSVYLYAITDGPSCALADDVFLISDVGLSAVVGTAPLLHLAALDPDDVSETGVLATLARAHDDVVRAVAARGAVLPLRFGTVLTGPDAVRRLLRDQRDAVRSALHLVAGCREWGVKVRVLPQHTDPRAPTHEPTAAAPESGPAIRPASGAAYLMQRRDALAAARHRAEALRRLAGDVHDVLAQHSRAAVNRRGAQEDLVLDGAYLVPTPEEAGFLSRAADLTAHAADAGTALELTGPWPPYSFAVLPVTGVTGDAGATGVPGDLG
jgi:hypothetical protein